jgi:hypothetical protein
MDSESIHLCPDKSRVPLSKALLLRLTRIQKHTKQQDQGLTNRAAQAKNGPLVLPQFPHSESQAVIFPFTCREARSTRDDEEPCLAYYACDRSLLLDD